MKDSSVDDFKELIDGGWIMLFIFGCTACFIDTASLMALFFLHETEITKIAIFKDLVIGSSSFLTGMFSTMWNNQHYKAQKNGNGKDSVQSLVDDQPIKKEGI